MYYLVDFNLFTDVPMIIIDEVSELVSNVLQYNVSADCLITKGNTWGDQYKPLTTSPTLSVPQSNHNSLSWTACYDDECMIHRRDKEA
ncbi:hypothetical protein L873DRAFT_1477104 [Choiromyces venosus 120613-1]|uniref:Uncharacterized protein n=1 Tax=Choiromyces venosus 120613-1 TaxID=1336337 RepID=A0A3N4J7K8_9PEZI|nr:hypothetical protein L873DRAFT_1477104 [Choiromyces venosus 120613-1]